MNQYVIIAVALVVWCVAVRAVLTHQNHRNLRLEHEEQRAYSAAASRSNERLYRLGIRLEAAACSAPVVTVAEFDRIVRSSTRTVGQRVTPEEFAAFVAEHQELQS